MYLLPQKAVEEGQVAEEEEAEGEGVAEIKAEHSTKAKRPNLTVMMRKVRSCSRPTFSFRFVRKTFITFNCLIHKCLTFLFVLQHLKAQRSEN